MDKGRKKDDERMEGGPEVNATRTVAAKTKSVSRRARGNVDSWCLIIGYDRPKSPSSSTAFVTSASSGELCCEPWASSQ